MNAFEAIVLGIIQGITEWLPVSSSGHLVIAQEVMGLPAGESLVFDLVVHMGTLLSVVFFFRKELWSIIAAVLTRKTNLDPRKEALRKLGMFLIIGTIPAAVVGVLLTNVIEDVFSPSYVGVALVLNGFLLFVATGYWSNGARKEANLKDSIAIGMFQAASIIPGISRSGSTICGGMFRGLERESAAVFAFLLSVPVLLGAFGYGVATLDTYDTDFATAALGFASAFLVGLASIGYLLHVVKKGQLWIFGVYCIAVGLAVVAWALG